MKVTETDLSGVILISPKIYEDKRGFFYESFNQKIFNLAIDGNYNFVQDNHSKSVKGTLRGIHYQIRNPQGKLVRVTRGEVFDVAVDLRKNSKNFMKWYGVKLSAENKLQLWVPPGFGHGFLVTSSEAEFQYKTTDFYYPEHERTLLWSDPTVNIKWPEFQGKFSLSQKDLKGRNIKDCEVFI